MAAVGDIWEAVLYCRLHTQEIRSVFHYFLSAISGTPNPTENTVGTSINSVLQGIWTLARANLSDEMSCYGIISARVKPKPRTAGTVTVPSGGNGAIVGSALPSSVALIIRKRTLFAGRAYRGRTYWAGVPVVQELDSALTAAGSTAWATVRDAMSAVTTPAAVNGTQITWTPVIYSKSSTLSNQIQSCSIDPIFRTQRRRQLGKGV